MPQATPACIQLRSGETERITIAFRWQEPYSSRYAGRLDGATETISSVTVDEDPDTGVLTISGATTNAAAYTEQDTQCVVAIGQAATWLVSGQVSGQCYTLECTVVTSTGRTLIETVEVCCE